MRAIILVLLTLGAAFAQTPVVIDSPAAPESKLAIVGALYCNVLGQHPKSSQAQIVCYLNGALVFNAVATIAANFGVSCRVVSPPANIAWSLVPAASPMIGYQIGAQVVSTGPPLVLGPITSTPTDQATAGTF